MESAIINILLIPLLIFSSALAQIDTSRSLQNKIDRFLYFIPGSNDIIALVYKENFQDTISNDWFWNSSINIWSSKNNKLIKEIPLRANEYVYAFNVSHDGLAFTIQSTERVGQKKEIHEIKQYSLSQDKWIWIKNWYNESPCIRLAYNEDNSYIICVTNKSVIILDSPTGSEIKSSNNIKSVFDEDYTNYTRMDLSKYGNYFVFWHNYIHAPEYSDESWIMSPFNPLTWPFRIIGAVVNLFSGKKYIYIWDVINDEIMHRIEIPKGVPVGSPAFALSEDTLFLGPIKEEYKLKVYALGEMTLLKEWEDSLVFTYGGDFKTISPNGKYLFEGFRVVEIETGNTIKQFAFGRLGGKMRDRYQAAFSPDGRYFAIEERGKICIYNIETSGQSWSVLTEIITD